LKIKCCSWPSRAIAVSVMTAGVMGGPANPGRVTKWTPTLMISPN
jgi:hypothetical protein